jgi:hypothetical protein
MYFRVSLETLEITGVNTSRRVRREGRLPLMK